MLTPITIRHDFRPARRSLATGRVADLFGLSGREPPHTIAEDLALDVRPGDVVLFTGRSGSGKSSLLRAVSGQLGAVDVASLALPDLPLVDSLPGAFEDRLAVLAGCGLGEARLLLRRPAELSDGERFRFRLAYALVSSSVLRPPSFGGATDSDAPRRTGDEGRGTFLACDEFAATLERTLAKVVAFNARRQATRTGVGLLAATTHDDLLDDLQPDLIVRCDHGRVRAERRTPEERPISFAHELRTTDGTRADWARFAAWHYRSHELAFTRRVVVLRHGEVPIGVCVFAAPAAALALRTRYFGLKNPRSSLALSALNDQLWLLQRVVIHPAYRGAGIGADFVRRACESCPVRWIETLSAMGHASPFFEHAGFTRVGVVRRSKRGRERSGVSQFAGPERSVSAETRRKSDFSDPVYYVFDNRGRDSYRSSSRHRSRA